jgi:hypothetical protein
MRVDRDWLHLREMARGGLGLHATLLPSRSNGCASSCCLRHPTIIVCPPADSLFRARPDSGHCPSLLSYDAFALRGRVRLQSHAPYRLHRYRHSTFFAGRPVLELATRPFRLHWQCSLLRVSQFDSHGDAPCTIRFALGGITNPTPLLAGQRRVPIAEVAMSNLVSSNLPAGYETL